MAKSAFTTPLRHQSLFQALYLALYLLLGLSVSFVAKADDAVADSPDAFQPCPASSAPSMAESSCLKNAGMQLDMEMNQLMHKVRRYLLDSEGAIDQYQVLTDLDTEHFNFLLSRKQRCYEQAKVAKAGYPQLISLQRCLISLTHQRIQLLSNDFPIEL